MAPDTCFLVFAHVRHIRNHIRRFYGNCRTLHTEHQWYPLSPHYLQWHSLNPNDLLLSPNNGLCWSPLNFNNTNWLPLSPNNSQWPPTDLHWSLPSTNDLPLSPTEPQWYPLGCNDPCWAPVLSNDTHGIPMTPNGTHCVLLILNELLWPLLTPHWASMTPMTGTILENYFGRRSPTCESELPMQLGYMRSCEPPARVQMHNPGKVH